MIENNIEIITLVYKSVDYLKLIYEQLKSENCLVDGWNIGIRIVLNDATDEIIEEVKKLDIEYTIYNDDKPDDYYLNRVYRCYNYAVENSLYDNVCLVNSDMVFSKNWMTNLLKNYNNETIVCSRLVESGKMPSGEYGISKNFGKSPLDIKYNEWEDYVENQKIDKSENGGLFMPCVFNRDRFIECGMYPEGNIYVSGIGNFGDKFVESGDSYFFNKLKRNYNMNHITVFDSLVYHIQEGEKDNG